MFEIIAKGGFVMAPLILCSVISVAVMIDRALFWFGQRKGISALEFLKLIETGKEKDGMEKARASKSSLITMLAAGVENKNPSADPRLNHAGASIAMESIATEEVIKIKKYLPAMDTIITLAPLLGLLGTIIGMVRSFDIMSLAGLGQPHAVTGGVAEALIATATGLAVAITTLVPYNFFLTKVEKTVEEMEYYATRLELILVRQKKTGMAVSHVTETAGSHLQRG
ncbi:MAG: MotA/TolQ/ExbB proton channel family protein [Deltaproteobacteria bacterium]|nr:MotA/TolQ/ExbB proton channel family protein [Deltaproteobacteria bacterium]